MTRSKSLAALAFGASLLALSACGEEQQQQSSEAPPPATQQQDDAGQALDDAGDAANDALSRLRDAAGQTAEEAGRLAGEARERAERALEDAGPTIDQARDIAGRIGQSIEEIAQQARQDLTDAAAALERRIASETGGTVPDEPVGDPAALLGPEDELSADTRAAARASMAHVGSDYVGAWAASAESCARIDREPLEMFAVITPTTMRRYESVCNIEPAETVNGETTVAASCIAEGMEEERQISFDTSETNTLRISQGDNDGIPLVRCSLP
ncbi:hypothetical protein GTW25_05335 [Aliihoeflea aestuarii]|jgi:hypothetical protein|uniref:hypothetical protein n=1 Tax=Aliihoeflea aestuarii TaxID=453840 RepID=UPI002092160B|nr:hypothetical protein [Aliihoeflea aestuarii]MCO6390449.1 hypothetical protein [Aliihoeflea aestuarii]